MNTNQTDAYDWICRIIETCNHQFHFDAVERLIILYGDYYKDEQGKYNLEMIAAKKFNEIHNILS